MDTTTEPRGLIYGIYDKREPDRIRYIGQTRDVVKRWRTHKHEAKTRPRGRLYAWMSSPNHPQEYVDLRVLEDGIPVGTPLDDAEIRHIAALRGIGQSDLNMTDGGYGCRGYVQTPAQRKKVSAFMSGRFVGEAHGGSKLTWQAVREIRELRNSAWVSETDLARDYGVTQMTINSVLRNLTWVDKDFDTATLKTRPPETHRNNFSIGWEKVREIRSFRQGEWLSDIKCAEKFGVTHSIINAIINNDKWHDPEFRPDKIKRNGVGGRRNTKITAADVIEIRRRVKAGEFQRIIGEDFGLAQPQVGRIARGDRWGNIKEGL